MESRLSFSEQEKQRAIREREQVYQNLSETVTKQVPIDEMKHLIDHLKKHLESYEQTVAFNESYDAFPWDGGVALSRAPLLN